MDSLELINTETRLAYNLAAQRYHDLFHNELDEKDYDRKEAGFFLEMIEKRNPYDFEISNERIFAIGKKV